MTKKRGGWPYSGFGIVLQQLRKSVDGLSQAKLAAMAGVHPMTISHLERGKYEPTWPLALALADALGVSVEAFRPAKDSTKKRGNK